MKITTHFDTDEESKESVVHPSGILKTPEHNAFSVLHHNVKKQSIQMTKNGQLMELSQSSTAEGKKAREAKLSQKRIEANQRIRKAALYGVGARSILPEVVKGSHEVNLEINMKEKQIYSIVPPGAHEDLFRYHKTSKYSDQIVLNSGQLQNEITLQSQPAWYFGVNNKCKPPDSNISSAVKRYGFRGSKNIEQHLVEPIKSPLYTVTENTPVFLSEFSDVVNEYNPPVFLAPVGSVNCREAPRLWPKEAEYVTGSKLKTSAPSSAVRPGTTIRSIRPQTVTELDSLTSQVIKQRDNHSVGLSRLFDHRSFTAPEARKSIVQPQPVDHPITAPASSQPVLIRSASVESYDFSVAQDLNETAYSRGDTRGVQSSRGFSRERSPIYVPMRAMYPSDGLPLSRSIQPAHVANTTITRDWEDMLNTAGARILPSYDKMKHLKLHHDRQKRTLYQQQYQKHKYGSNGEDEDEARKIPTIGNRGLADSQDTLSSIGTLSIIRQGMINTKHTALQSQVNETLSKASISYGMKWQQIELHMNSLRVHIDRNESMVHVIQHISKALKEEASLNAPWRRLSTSSSLARRSSIRLAGPPTLSTYWMADRMTFIGTLSKLSYLEGFHERQFSLMFSIFDIKRSNTLEYIEYISSLLVLADPQINLLDRLRMIYEYILEYGTSERSAMDVALKTCCSAVSDLLNLKQIEFEFKREFRCKCYAAAVLDSPVATKKSPRAGTSVAVVAATAAVIRSAVEGPGADGVQNFHVNFNSERRPSGIISPFMQSDVNTLTENSVDCSTARRSSRSSSFMSNVLQPGAQTARHQPTPLELTALPMHASKNGAVAQVDSLNTVENYLNSSTFLHVLESCPKLLSLVESSIDARLTQYYGQNYRNRMSEGYITPAHTKDAGPKFKFGAAVAHMKLFRPPKRTDDDDDDDDDDGENDINSDGEGQATADDTAVNSQDQHPPNLSVELASDEQQQLP
jgi:hypothetical protein